METYKELKEQHPYWTIGNLHYILDAQTARDAIRNEVLLQSLCHKCGKEMGAHRFTAGKFLCDESAQLGKRR